MELLGYEVHKAADDWPMFSDEDLKSLAEDIKANGLQVPIVLWQDATGKRWIVDGRNRALACDAAGVTPKFETWTCGVLEMISTVRGLNNERRHLETALKWACNVASMATYSEEERAQLSAKYEAKTAPRGGANNPAGRAGKKKPPPKPEESIGHKCPIDKTEPPKQDDKRRKEAQFATEELGVSRAMHRKCMEAFAKEGAPPPTGDPAVDTLARTDIEKVREAIANSQETGTAGVTKKLREKKKASVRQTNAAQELNGKFSLVLADPPWHYSNSGLTGNAADQYPTMKTPDICAIPIKEHVTDNAILFLWVTNPFVCDGVEVARAWGFEPKTMFVWVKNRATPAGFYCRSRTEMLWVCTRGQGMTVEPEDLPDNVIDAPVGKHSAKPEEAYALIERLYPQARKLEMFCRKAREGWEVFGNEC